ncbi:Uncharacterized protein APZ42_004039, partial [Daphnia magna]
HKQGIEEGTVLGIIEPVTEIKEGDTPDWLRIKADRQRKDPRSVSGIWRLFFVGRRPTRTVYGSRAYYRHRGSKTNSIINRIIIEAQCKEMEKTGVIEPSNCPCGAAVVLVRKKDGTWRFCVDYRRLNAVTIRDVYPLPRIEETLARLEGAEFFSIMDLQSGYWQVPIKESDRPKTAFVTADGLYQFKVMAMRLCSAPGTFQRMMDLVLSGLRWTTCLVYLDDIVAYSRSLDEHVQGLRGVLGRLRGANLKVKVEKLQAVRDFPYPPVDGSIASKVKNIRAFLGMCSYYRRFIDG